MVAKHVITLTVKLVRVIAKHKNARRTVLETGVHGVLAQRLVVLLVLASVLSPYQACSLVVGRRVRMRTVLNKLVNALVCQHVPLIAKGHGRRTAIVMNLAVLELNRKPSLLQAKPSSVACHA